MRALPCFHPTCSTRDAEGVYRGRATLRGGGLYVLGRAPARWPYRYPCGTCHRVTDLSATRWNQLPHLNVADLTKLGLLERLTQDLRGAGWEPSQAVDLLAAGFAGPAALEPLEAGRHDPLRSEEKNS